jgi:hypothetical protein
MEKKGKCCPYMSRFNVISNFMRGKNKFKIAIGLKICVAIIEKEK